MDAAGLLSRLPAELQSAAAKVSPIVVLLLVGLLAGLYVAVKVARALADALRISAGLASVPSAPGGNWLLGHVFPLIQINKKGLGAWDLMEQWLKDAGTGIVKYRVLNTQVGLPR